TTALVDEVDLSSIELRREMSEAVHRHFPRTPVVLAAPVVDELPHVRHAEATLPVVVSQFVDPARATETHGKVIQQRLRDLNVERLNVLDGALGVWQATAPLMECGRERQVACQLRAKRAGADSALVRYHPQRSRRRWRSSRKVKRKGADQPTT